MCSNVNIGWLLLISFATTHNEHADGNETNQLNDDEA